MCRAADRDLDHAQWILIQASRSFICGSDRIAQFDRSEWKLEPGGKRVAFGAAFCNRDHLWTGT
ncbi:hypothetical protein MTF65_14765 [Streptomyces sp. APSN-46.1]|uniref:hypothetical protein n=1 Tax=Streptomyces sp. APSN-46.1 TaxID=2929049 RepID=UPI001FB2ECE5|nr:hypothetical protein [Streptomyces sp. APSN-46.1]MCJ1678590.1 hypothetical protein [Streptomyces sp. APSN-46.1]